MNFFLKNKRHKNSIDSSVAPEPSFWQVEPSFGNFRNKPRASLILCSFMHFLVQFWQDFGKKANSLKDFKGELFWKAYELSRAFWAKIRAEQSLKRAEPRLGGNTYN